jgi:hypothetical protein
MGPVAVGQAPTTVGLAAQVGLALFDQGGDDRVLRLHGVVAPLLLETVSSGTVGVRPPPIPQVQTLDFGLKGTLFVQLSWP